MIALPLHRPRLRTDQSTVARRESRRNIEDFFMLLARVRSGSFCTPGVVEGLSVSAALGQSTVQVSLGAALDPLGRMILLADGGWARLHEAKPALVAGSVVELPAVSDGEVLLTIEWHEWTDSDAPSGSPPVLHHTPWLKWTKGTDRNEHQMVLARFDLGNDGKIRSFSHTDRLSSNCRASSVTFRGASSRITETPSFFGSPGSIEHSVAQPEIAVISYEGIVVSDEAARFSWFGTDISVDVPKGAQPTQLRANLMVGEEVILAITDVKGIIESSQPIHGMGNLHIDPSGAIGFSTSESDDDYWLLQVRDGSLVIQQRGSKASLELQEDKILLGFHLGADGKGHWVSQRNESTDAKVKMKAKTVTATGWRQYPSDPATRIPVEHTK